MSRPPLPRLMLPALAAAVLGTAGPAPGQDVVAEAVEYTGRREQDTPGLVIETGARTAEVDVLTFTADGKHLLAAGDDKVVRTWAVGDDGKLGPDALPTLRWPIYREHRGDIYTMAFSPDEKQVVVAGHGVLKSGFAAAVIDRATGNIVHATGHPTNATEVQGTIWACAFSPTGKRIALGSTETGQVWVWTPGAGEPVPVGRHDVKGVKNPWHKLIRLVAFDPTDPAEETVISVCGTGEMVRFHRKDPKGVLLHRFSGPADTPVVRSPDGKWVGFIPKDLDKLPGNWWAVELVSFPDGQTKRTITTPDQWSEKPPQERAMDRWQDVPHRLAFSSSGRYLAVTLRRTGRPQKGVPSFFQERTGRVVVYDLAAPGQRPEPVGETPEQGLYPAGLTFHPTNEHWLATAGGPNHDVFVWDWKAGKKLGEVPQPGRALWGVALSPDGTKVAFQTGPNDRSPHPNDRGAGPWRFFDLADRRYLPGAPFKPTRPAPSVNGWSVVAELGGNGFPTPYWTVAKGGKQFKLPWPPSEDEFPRCYAFLPGDKGRPDRLIVGHYWGASVFELSDDKPPVRTRVLRGHDGYVTSIAVSADGKKVVTASRDMTLAGWTLADWEVPGAEVHPRLGAELSVLNGQLVVGKVASGSPAWEMGLEEGDVIVALQTGVRTDDGFEPRVKYVRRPIAHAGRVLRPAKETSDPLEALRAMRRTGGDFAPNNEHLFYWVKPNDPRVHVAVTTLVDRPLWRFFPHGETEWVLWRYRDYYYDCSTRGDFAIGWQRSYKLATLKKPEFYRAEQLRATFLRTDLLGRTLGTWESDQALVAFNQIEPPEVAVSEPEEVAGGYRVTVSGQARGPQANQQPKRVLVWANDCLLFDLSGADLPVADGKFERTVVVPRDRLRSGENLVTAQCYGVGDGRSDATPRAVVEKARPGKPTLHAVLVGVSDYGASNPRQVNLNAATDAAVIRQALEVQAAKPTSPFAQVKVTPLLNRDVTRGKVLDALDGLRKEVRPDDVLVFYLGGHGTSQAELARRKVPAELRAGLGRFLFLCGDFDLKRMRDTTINFEELQDRLARLPCHKLLLLDSCHSGGAKTAGGDTADNPIRVVTRHGIGSVILAACGPDQQAIENPAVDPISGAAGLFTMGLQKLLTEADDFDAADRDRNGRLDAAELAAGITAKVTDLVAVHNRTLKKSGAQADQQTPVTVVPRLEERVLVAGR